MNTPYLLAIDQGTTSTRAIIFNAQAELLHVSQCELTQHYPQSSWVEHDATQIWEHTVKVTKDVIQKAGGAKSIAAIGITNQRETTILWDKRTGKPIYNAIVWQDRRTASFCQDLKDKGMEELISSKTGLLIDPYFSCSKIKWILDHVDNARALATDGHLLFGTIDSFLLWNLTGGKVHATDYTNAARTGLFNIRTHAWDDALLELYDIPASLLPDVKDNAADFGHTDAALFGAPIPIGGMAGDQHAALIGQCCFKEGMVKSTYGTGCFALMNIGTEFKQSKNKLLTTPAYRLNGQTHYAIEGSIFMAGAIVQWLRDALGIIKEAAETENLATSLPDNDGVYLIPAFTGLGAPYWNPNIKAALFGLTRRSSKAHIARAALEAQAYQTMDLMNAMAKDSNTEAQCLRVDGGLVNNNFVCQFLADITRKTIDVPVNTETTALGAAFLAGLQSGVYSSLDDLTEIWRMKKSFAPAMDLSKQEQYYAEWQAYIDRLL